MGNPLQGMIGMSVLGAAGLGTLRARGVAEQPQPPAFTNIGIKTDSDGNKSYKVEMPEQTLNMLQELIQQGAMAQAAYSEAIQRTAQHRQQLEESPVLSAVGRIASALAAQYQGQGRGGPIVRGIGEAVYPYFARTPEELSREEALLAEKRFDIARETSRQGIAFAGQERQLAALEAQTSATIEGQRLEQERINAANKRAEENNLTSMMGGMTQQAGQGEIPDRATTVELLMRLGAPAEKANAFAANLEQIAIRAQAEKTRAAKEQHQRNMELAGAQGRGSAADLKTNQILGQAEKINDDLRNQSTLKSQSLGAITSLVQDMGITMPPDPKTGQPGALDPQKAYQEIVKRAAAIKDPEEKKKVIEQANTAYRAYRESSSQIPGLITSREALVKRLPKDLQESFTSRPAVPLDVSRMSSSAISAAWQANQLPNYTQEQIVELIAERADQERAAAAAQAPAPAAVPAPAPTGISSRVGGLLNSLDLSKEGAKRRSEERKKKREERANKPSRPIVRLRTKEEREKR